MTELLRQIGANPAILLFIAGAVSSLATQLIKTANKWKKDLAFTLAFVVAASLGLLSSWATNNYISINDFVSDFTTIYTISAVFYKAILEPQFRIKELEDKLENKKK